MYSISRSDNTIKFFLIFDLNVDKEEISIKLLQNNQIKVNIESRSDKRHSFYNNFIFNISNFNLIKKPIGGMEKIAIFGYYYNLIICTKNVHPIIIQHSVQKLYILLQRQRYFQNIKIESRINA